MLFEQPVIAALVITGGSFGPADRHVPRLQVGPAVRVVRRHHAPVRADGVAVPLT